MYSKINELEINPISEEQLIENKNEIINLLEENLKINFPNFDNLSEYAKKSYEDMVRFKQDNSAIIIGAFINNKIIGFLWAYRRTVFGEKRIHIGHIVVDSNCRSTGIGSIMLKKLEEISKIEEIKKIELITTIDNEDTMQFYKSKGFTKVRVQLEKELGGPNDNR